MIQAYLAGISSPYEGEDIEIQYSIYENQQLTSKESVLMEYQKPAVVGQVALITLLKKLENFIDEEIVIVINDSALNEIVRGTSTTKNKDVLSMAIEMKEELSKFANCIIEDVSINHIELTKWKIILSRDKSKT